MKIPEITQLQMNRIDASHYGTKRIEPLTAKNPGFSPVSSVQSVSRNSEAVSVQPISQNGVQKKTFSDYLIEAVNSVNSQQLKVSNLQEKIITNPDEVDIHDVTIAMSKARMSLNLAQTVIDRLVSGWNEITTTR